MKRLLLLALLSLSSQVFAQVCEVDMTNRYNQVVRTFRAYGAPDTCIEGMKECRKTIRLQPQLGGVDCVRRGDYNPPNPPHQNPSISYYLSMSNYQLAQEAMYGIGSCKVIQGSYSTSCQYYMKVNGYGFGGGTGCAQEQYTRTYGCYSNSEFENAGCLTRIALQNRQCI